ncbi:TadE/TadG family type IV pilus assembly protein [Magnetovibrio sp. PR-2]|uniref:TadE/TadG family type IV pilus assembly protein n=1 Tax=Magnetovibrio sp. PR-2 TaxID=3120356 RepID=UPI002FCE4795
MMITFFKRFWSDNRGVAAIEFALTAPFMCVVLLGVAELNNYMTAARKTAAAAFTAADLIAQETDITSSNLSELLLASRKVIHPLDDTNLTLGVSSVRFDDTTGDPSVDWTGNYNSGSVSGATTLATGMGDAGESVIIVTAHYTYTPLFSLVMSGTYTLEETAITRPRYIDYVGLY